jgi:hypothetical protein
MDKQLRDAVRRRMDGQKESWWASNDLIVIRQDADSYINASEKELANTRDEMMELIGNLHRANSDSIGEPQVFFPNYGEMILPIDMESPDPGDYWFLTYSVSNLNKGDKDELLAKFSDAIEEITRKNRVVAEVITRLSNNRKVQLHAFLNSVWR